MGKGWHRWPFFLFRRGFGRVFASAGGKSCISYLTIAGRHAKRRTKFIKEVTVMSINRFALPFALGLGLTGFAALAQTTTEQPAAEQPAADAASAEGLSMGADAAPGMKTKETAAVGEVYLAGNFGLWENRCEKTEADTDPCQLYQLLRDKDGQAVAEISLFTLPAGGQAVAGATIIAPLETLLTQNLQIAIDDAKAKIYPFTFCFANGCVARVGFTAEEVDQFKKGGKATVTIIPAAAPETKVSVEMSLKGFTAAYDSLGVPAAAGN